MFLYMSIRSTNFYYVEVLGQKVSIDYMMLKSSVGRFQIPNAPFQINSTS